MIKKFINQKVKDIDRKCCMYSWWYVSECDWHYIISSQQYGAEETFSIWQWVYDEDWHLMWYMWIWLFDALTYANAMKTPVEYWTICTPTKHCKKWKKVITYWQKYFKEHKEE